MTKILTSMDTAEMLNLNTNTDYLGEDDAFDTNTVVAEWPEATNPFAVRMAKAMKLGTHIQSITPDALMDVFGALARLQPTKTFTFAVDLQPKDGGMTMGLMVVDVSNGAEPPLSADNAGFFKYAINWFAGRKSLITLSVTSDALFWVHRD